MVVALTNTLARAGECRGYMGMYEEYMSGELYKRLSK